MRSKLSGDQRKRYRPTQKPAISDHQFYSTTEQYKYSDNVDTNEVETGMTRLIALTVTPVY